MQGPNQIRSAGARIGPLVIPTAERTGLASRAEVIGNALSTPYLRVPVRDNRNGGAWSHLSAVGERGQDASRQFDLDTPCRVDPGAPGLVGVEYRWDQRASNRRRLQVRCIATRLRRATIPRHCRHALPQAIAHRRVATGFHPLQTVPHAGTSGTLAAATIGALVRPLTGPQKGRLTLQQGRIQRAGRVLWRATVGNRTQGQALPVT